MFAKKKAAPVSVSFIVGAPRSGTTWLQKMLACHPEVATGTESDLFSYFVKALFEKWKLQMEPTGRGYMGLPTYITEEQFCLSINGFLRHLLVKMADGKQCFIEKTPQHALFLEEIHRILPEAKIIHLLRDPRDVSLSIMRASRKWSAIGAPSVRKAFSVWEQHVGAVMSKRSLFPAENFFEVRYDKLRVDTKNELDLIMQFLNLESSKEILERAIESNRIDKARDNLDVRFQLRGEIQGESEEPSGFVNEGQSGKWKQKLNCFQKILLERMVDESQGRFKSGVWNDSKGMKRGFAFVEKLLSDSKAIAARANRKRALRKERRACPPSQNFEQLRERVLSFVAQMRKGDMSGQYRYAPSKQDAILYASVYAALIRHLLGDLDNLDDVQRKAWVDYINSFQGEDGLYRDALLENDIAETEDWWGWRHLSAHVVSALTALGGKTSQPFSFLSFLYTPGSTAEWLSSLPWKEKPDYVSNTVMNYAVLLMYDRDVHGVFEAACVLDELFEYLDSIQVRETGLWGGDYLFSAEALTLSVQTAYHFFILYFYDKRPVQNVEIALENILATQNELGGYGRSLNSSACEDIDSIDPLCRFYVSNACRTEDIKQSLSRAVPWVLANQRPDGGFVFRHLERFPYGHERMTTDAGESNLFATWFRVLTLAYASQVLDSPEFPADKWKWIECPGYQFWRA